MMLSKNEVRMKRKIRIRKRLSGTSERPRLVVFRSNLHIYAQIIDDMTGGEKVACNKAGAEKVGKEVARIAKEKNITQVVFDRNGYLYHGRIKAIADGAREGGLEF